MVNKMHLKFTFVICLIICLSVNSFAADYKTSFIKQRQHVSCGISLDYKALAYQKNKIWYGFDADICRAVAAAVLDNPESFKLIPIKKENIGKALNSGQIDLMLGHSSLSSSEEISQYVTPIDTLYYDRIIFASRTPKEAQSMRDFSNARVCVLRNSAAASFLIEYNQQHALGFKSLELPDLLSLKEAFSLKRCELIIGSEIFIKDLVINLKSEEQPQLLPEEVAYLPIKAYSAGNAPSLNISFRWIINALKQAYAANMTSRNIQTFISTPSHSLQNLLGITPKAWQKLNLDPEWVKYYLPKYGNYQEILNRNIGQDSSLQLNIKQNDLAEKDGLLSYQPFI